MNRGQQEPLIVAIRRFHVHGAAIRRFQCQIRQKFIHGRIVFGNRMEMVQIPGPFRIVVVMFFENGEIVLIDAVDLFSRSQIGGARQIFKRMRKIFQSLT